MRILNLPRILIAGTASNVGKTTASMAVMAALNAAGLSVQPFKVGPDFIDPGFHQRATGRVSRNLDACLVEPENLKEIVGHAAAGADIALIEGVMGLFDSDLNGKGSTAAVAKLIGAPVVLVVNVRGQGHSVAASIIGFRQLDPDVNIAGVILNQVGSDRHLKILKQALDNIRMPLIGFIPQRAEIELEKRYLGLVQDTEVVGLDLTIQRLKALAEASIDLERVVKLADAAEPLHYGNSLFKPRCEKKVRIGVARDQAFNFYYQDNLDILSACGAELIYFSPLGDRRLPNGLDGLYFGGGYPEIFAEELSSNVSFRLDLRRAAELKKPIYAECGGLIYLTKGIMKPDKKIVEMCGLLPTRAAIAPKLQALGYRRAIALNDNLLVKRERCIKGHEFHYSKLKDCSNAKRAYRIVEGDKVGRLEGFASSGLLASYIHLHFATNPTWAERFVNSCTQRERG